MSKLKSAVLMVVAAVAGGWLWQALHDDTRVVTQTQVVKEYVFAPASEKAASTEASIMNPLGAAPATPAAQPSELGAKLMQAKDMKSYVLEMLKPEQVKRGGAFYALQAMLLCANGEIHRPKADGAILRVVAEKSTISAEQLAQIKEGEAKCGSLSDAEREDLEDEAHRHILAGEDPLGKLLAVKGPKRLLTIVEYKNLAVASATSAPFLLLKRTYKDGGLYTTFNGQTYGPEDNSAINAAASLSTCVEGDYCKLEAERKVNCWYEAKCYPTREAFIQAHYLNGDPKQLEKARTLAQQMQQAMMAGDASVFHRD